MGIFPGSFVATQGGFKYVIIIATIHYMSIVLSILHAILRLILGFPAVYRTSYFPKEEIKARRNEATFPKRHSLQVCAREGSLTLHYCFLDQYQ